MKKIGVAVVGYGYWGPNLVRNFVDNPDCRLITVCDKKPKLLAPIRLRYPEVQCTADVDDVLRDLRIDAVVIATQVSTHYALCRRVLESGRHVLVEKPMAMSTQEADRLLELAQKKRKTLMVGHTFIYSPPVRKIHDILRKDGLGRIYYMDFSRVNLGLFQPDVNVIWDLAPHDISIILFWLKSAPISVRVHARSFISKNNEDVGYLWMEFPNNIITHMHVTWLAPIKLRRVSIVGSKRMLVYDDTESVEKIKIYDQGVITNAQSFGEYQLSYRFGDILSPKVGTKEPLALECADFIHCIRTATKPQSDSRLGFQVVRVLEGAQRSLRKDGALVKL